jgi:hypothetical protein
MPDFGNNPGFFVGHGSDYDEWLRTNWHAR